MATLTRLLTDKADPGRIRAVETPADLAADPGEVVLQLERFALTTNNITYAAFGEAMNYWDFFPAAEAGWGHMPVWGFADVVTSDIGGIEPGERFYGYFPIASHVRMRPERVSPRGFYDGAAHRRELVSAYNQYTRCSADEAYRADLADYQMLLRPLFITSFMLADFLRDNAFFGATRLVVSSASAKTAYGTVFCLAEVGGVEIVGLTSSANRDFVAGLGCYDRAVAYGDIATLKADRPTLYVDFSGDDGLRATIHRHFGAALVYDCFAGSTANTTFLAEAELPGPKPQFYFAPVQIRKRNADWGAAEVTRRMNAAQSRFFARAAAAEAPWLNLRPQAGLAGVPQLVADLHGGRADPRDGHVVRLG